MSASRPLQLAVALAFAGPVAAQFMPFGTGCPGSVGVPELLRAQLRGTATIQTTNLSQTGLAALLVGPQRYPSGLDLGAIGAPGCDLYVASIAALPMIVLSNQGLVGLPISSMPPCLEFYVQTAAVDFGANPLGVVMSNAASIMLDPVAEVVRHNASPTIFGDETLLDIPSINARPGALALFTGTWNGFNNWSNTALRYDELLQRWGIVNQGGAQILGPVGYHVFLPNSGATQFVVTADAGNTQFNLVRIDHPSCNGQPDAMVFANQVVNPGGGPIVYNDSPIGVYYDGSHWTVFNEDTNAMPLGASFNVVVADEHLATSQPAFVHHVTAATASGNRSRLDHPELNDNPDARIILTRRWAGQYEDQQYDTFYTNDRWHVRHHAGGLMNPGDAFNVLISESTPRRIQVVRVANAANTTGQSMRLDLPVVDGDPDARMFVTQHWSPGSEPGVYNAHPIGVFYSPSAARWYVFNEDVAPMPLGASFNVFVPNSAATTLVTQASSSNTTGNVTRIDHPGLNGRPDVLPLVTQLWNPGGISPGVYNDVPVGVWFDGTHWNVFREDQTAMPLGAAFNVLVPDERLDASSRVLRHRATAGNTTNHITRLDHPDLNGKPFLLLQVTQSWDHGVYNNHPIGVYYAGDQWRIFNQDFANMPVDASFHVLVGENCQ